jgi:hypothetical protein
MLSSWDFRLVGSSRKRSSASTSSGLRWSLGWPDQGCQRPQLGDGPLRKCGSDCGGRQVTKSHDVLPPGSSWNGHQARACRWGARTCVHAACQGRSGHARGHPRWRAILCISQVLAPCQVTRGPSHEMAILGSRMSGRKIAGPVTSGRRFGWGNVRTTRRDSNLAAPRGHSPRRSSTVPDVQ